MSAVCGTMQRGRCAPTQWNRRYPGFSLFSSSRTPSFIPSFIPADLLLPFSSIFIHSLLVFSPFFLYLLDPLLPLHFFCVRLLPLSPLARSRMPVRINELSHGFLLQRDPSALGPHRLGYNRFEATAISDMRVQTNRQYSRAITLFSSPFRDRRNKLASSLRRDFPE